MYATLANFRLGQAIPIAVHALLGRSLFLGQVGVRIVQQVSTQPLQEAQSASSVQQANTLLVECPFVLIAK